MDMKIVTRDIPEYPYLKKYLVLDHPLLMRNKYFFFRFCSLNFALFDKFMYNLYQHSPVISQWLVPSAFTLGFSTY